MRRPWLARIALSTGVTLAALLAGELTLRALDVAPDRYAQSVHLESDDKRVGLDLYPDDPRDYLPLDLRDPNERRRWRERGLREVDARYERTPHAVGFTYTAELCRGAIIPPRDPATARIVVIGDSFTEGQGVREEDAYPALLDRRRPEEVVNCGRRGYDFPELAAWFERHLALEPDIVVYGMLLNDPAQSEAFHAQQAYIDDWIVDRRRMVAEGDGSPPLWEPRILSVLHDRIEGLRVGAATTRWYQEITGEPNREGWEATLAQIASMDAAMRARGGRFVVVLWPLLIDLDRYPFTEAHRTIGDALRARSIRFRDALGAFEGRDARSLWVHPVDRHPNEHAHAIFAREVEAALREE